MPLRGAGHAGYGNDDEDEPVKSKASIEEEDDDISPIDSLDAAADAEDEEEEETAVSPCPFMSYDVQVFKQGPVNSILPRLYIATVQQKPRCSFAFK